MACSIHTAILPQDLMPNVPADSIRAERPVFQGASDAFPKAFHAFSSPSPKIVAGFAHTQKIPARSSEQAGIFI